MHLSRVEDEFMHKVDKEIDKDTVCVKRMGDNKVPMYKEKSPARDTADQDQIQIVTEDESDRRVLMYKEKLLARETADQGRIQTVTEDEGDCREFTERRELHSGSPSPISKPTSTADPSPVRPALQPPLTMIQSTVMSATRG